MKGLNAASGHQTVTGGGGLRPHVSCHCEERSDGPPALRAAKRAHPGARKARSKAEWVGNLRAMRGLLLEDRSEVFTQRGGDLRSCAGLGRKTLAQQSSVRIGPFRRLRRLRRFSRLPLLDPALRDSCLPPPHCDHIIRDGVETLLLKVSPRPFGLAGPLLRREAGIP